MAEEENTPTSPDGSPPANSPEPVGVGGELDWKAVAQRLRADQHGFRKRQRRTADLAVSAERARLLLGILPLVDNLEHALRVENPKDLALWKGVALVRRELMRFLESEGVVHIEALGKPFDADVHEAIAQRPGAGVPGTVVEETQAGYMLGDKLLRPAKVVVAS